MTHNLKIDKVFLDAKLAGDKLFEVRCNDRGFQKGDIIEYREYYGVKYAKIYEFVITYVTNYMQKENYVVFGEKRILEEIKK